MKIGISGYGGHMFTSHVPFLAGHDVEVTTVYDPSDDAWEKARGTHGTPVRRAHSHLDLLASDVEAVFIGGPDKTHAEALRAAIAAGKHVFVEKPLACSTADLELVAEAFEEARERGLVVLTCHPTHFFEPSKRLSAAVVKLGKDLGKPLHYQFDMAMTAPFEGSWKSDGAHSFLLDHFTHEFYQFLHIFGLPEYLNAVRHLDGFDRYSVTGVHSGGASFCFVATRTLETLRRHSETVRIRFERGLLEMELDRGSGSVTNYEALPHRQVETIPGLQLIRDYDAAHEAITANFLAAVRGNESPYVGREVILLMARAAVQLHETGIFNYSVLAP